MGEKKYYIEYSPDRECFHVGDMESIIENNMHMMKSGIFSGYIIIGWPFSYSQSIAFKNEILKTIGRPNLGDK